MGWRVVSDRLGACNRRTRLVRSLIAASRLVPAKARSQLVERLSAPGDDHVAHLDHFEILGHRTPHDLAVTGPDIQPAKFAKTHYPGSR